MKQGQATSSHSGSTKVEPKSQAVNPGAAGNIGIQALHTHSQLLYEGRGLEAPMAGTEIHHYGSQGHHK